MFPIHRIDQLQAEDIEYLGTKRKFWFRREGERVLFKAEERGTGEDWAEKIVCELAALLGLPHVSYELAHAYEGDEAIQPGVICASFAPPPSALVMGNQLLFERDASYPRDPRRGYGVREHTVERVAQVLHGLLPPGEPWMTNCPPGVTTALGVFVGYVLLDAWTANQDRHHQNWGAVQAPDGSKRLAPTYDHGAALARNLGDEERKARMESRDAGYALPRFASQARSGFYGSVSDKKTVSSNQVFRAFAKLDAVAARVWLDKLASIDSPSVESVVSNIPPARMTPVTRRFTLALLDCNRHRLLEVQA